ncbi:MAG: hypothetical protein JOY65_14195 [Acetobacteraceae bacterium]|nr:hypothetical protein [Acetobacteraceae bacterium]MBV9777987.1 hypothetical protein [Acetobacteraceae bacterium]
MKIKLDVDCSAEEARAFLGLPDLRPMQATLMADLERRMRETIAGWSPETVLGQWLTMLPQGAQQIQKMMEGFLRSGGTDTKRGGQP